LHQLSQACVFIYSSRGKWVLPPLLWRFPPTTTFTSFPVPDCWACGATPAGWHVCLQLTWEVGFPLSPVEFSSHHCFYKLSCSWLLHVCCHSCLLWPGLFIYSSVRDSPPPFSTQGAPLSLLHVFIVVIAYYSVSLFSSGWGLVCPGEYADLAQGCLWEYHIPLSSPCGVHLPKPPGHRCLVVAWGPSWFLCLTLSGDALHSLEVWRG
jgi:hypothetical protein